MHLSLELDTRGDGDFLDITSSVAEKVKGSGVASGVVVVLVQGSTAALTLNEYEPGLLEDLKALVKKLVPPAADYRHNLAWQEKNATSHLRACLFGFSLAIPFREGQLILGTWQQIILLEFDTRPRHRILQLSILPDGG
jgi:secondary thiamine-phosphate synthase enzyme